MADDRGDETTTAVADDGTTIASTGSTSGVDSSSSSTGLPACDEPTTGTESGPIGCGFICPPEYECDLFLDEECRECPAGEKCVATEYDRVCAPVASDPVAVGDPCELVAGVDECDATSVCWSPVYDADEGTCVPLCHFSSSERWCDDPSSVCASDGLADFCLPVCDPLAQDCGAGEGCYFTFPVRVFMCAPDLSGEAGAYGEPCELQNECDPGLFCAAADYMPSCDGEDCCSVYCDLTDPEASCPEAANGQQCLGIYGDQTPPAGLEHVGLCVVEPLEP